MENTKEIEVFEDKRSFEQEGITGSITRYTTTTFEYPCIIITHTAEHPIMRFQVEALKRIMQTNSSFGELKTDEQFVTVYIQMQDVTTKYGKVSTKQMRLLLSTFEKNKLVGYYSDGRILEDFMVYVLAD